MKVHADRDLRLCASGRRVPMLDGQEVVMGMFRRLTYIGTHGVVDFRSDSERIARYSKKLSNEHKKAKAPAHRSNAS